MEQGVDTMTKKSSYNELHITVGSVIKFGEDDWKVLDLKNDKALLISEEILETRQYHKEFTDITWEHCSLRKYLNGKFLQSFASADRNRIIETRIKTSNNPLLGALGGKDTKDFIFLLSLDEVKRFFPTDDDRTVIYCGSAHWWWLRSPGQSNARAARVNNLGGVGIYANGAISRAGERIVNNDGGIRPALWIKL